MAANFVELAWKGERWRVMDTAGTRRSPGGNVFDKRNVSVLPNGNLQLEIAERDGVWTCADLHMERGFGFGRYRWGVATDITRLDPNAVLGLFTYDWNHWQRDGEAAGELDIEFTRWGDPHEKRNCWLTVQPAATRFGAGIVVPSRPPYDCWMTWQPDSIDFVVRDATKRVLRQRTTRMPQSPDGDTWPFMDLWLMNHLAPKVAQRVELTYFRHERVAD